MHTLSVENHLRRGKKHVTAHPVPQTTPLDLLTNPFREDHPRGSASAEA